jgi:hypothetical protein
MYLLLVRSLVRFGEAGLTILVFLVLTITICIVLWSCYVLYVPTTTHYLMVYITPLST